MFVLYLIFAIVNKLDIIESKLYLSSLIKLISTLLLCNDYYIIFFIKSQYLSKARPKEYRFYFLNYLS